jgi:hypothetical protein
MQSSGQITKDARWGIRIHRAHGLQYINLTGSARFNQVEITIVSLKPFRDAYGCFRDCL